MKTTSPRDGAKPENRMKISLTEEGPRKMEYTNTNELSMGEVEELALLEVEADEELNNLELDVLFFDGLDA